MDPAPRREKNAMSDLKEQKYIVEIAKAQGMEFDSVDTIWNLVSEGFGFSMASEFCPPGGLDVELFSMGARPVTWKFVVMTRVGGTISVPIQSVIDIARQEFGNEKS